MSAAFSAPYHAGAPGVDARNTAKDIAAQQADNVKVDAIRIEYMPQPNGQDGSSWRIARAKCRFCPEKNERHEQRPKGGEWPTDFEAYLTKVAGWVLTDTHAYCGATCRARQAMRDKDNAANPITPVMKINDASYARTMYAKAQTVVTPGPAEPAPAVAKPRDRRA